MTFAFSRPLRRGVALLFLVVFGSRWFSETAHADDTPRANVLFIMVDDLRPELSSYGHPLVQSPNIDRIARDGTLFRRAYAQQALCAPSRASLLTGLRPDSTGIHDLSHPVRKTIPDVRTLPQHFKEAGYETISLGKIYHHSDDDNGIGWSRPAWMPAGAMNHAAHAQNAPLTPHGRTTAWEVADVPDNFYADGKLAERAVAEIVRLKESGRPFFLAVGFFKPHLPFFAPKRYWDLYRREDIVLPPNQTWPADMPALAGSNWEELRNYRGIPKEGPLPEEMARTLIHGYYASVRYIDAMIGQVLDALDREGLRENTVVAICGDHGWKLDEHGAWCKHTNHEVDARTPLIIRPARKSAAAGQPSSALVELVDLYPTFAELCGLEIPSHCEGLSLAPLFHAPERAWKPAAFTQYPRGGAVMGYSVRDERWRYTEWFDRAAQRVIAAELYDHAEHVIADRNLASDPAHAAEVARLAALLDRGRGWRKLQRMPDAAR